ncbi:MAG: hypothetical protein AAFX46_22135 [Cyanobacteria bacterium J06636_27]
MTPTLFGRWQTRLLLLFTVGLFVSLPFAMGLIGSPPGDVYFWILFYVAIFGLGWDVVYNQIQKYRWDRDWPAVHQLFAGIWEFIFIVCGVKILGFLPTPIPKEELPLFWVFFHYFAVWLAVFLISQSLMRIIFVRWRFFGGQWL